MQVLIAQLRYAAHTLSFDESNHWQKLWALYTAGCCSAQLTKRLTESGPLRVDWIDSRYTHSGRLGLTILPGRQDYRCSLPDDLHALHALRAQGVAHVVPLIAHDEFHAYGVDKLLEAYRQADFSVRHQPIFDQRVCSLAEMQDLVSIFPLQVLRRVVV